METVTSVHLSFCQKPKIQPTCPTEMMKSLNLLFLSKEYKTEHALPNLITIRTIKSQHLPREFYRSTIIITIFKGHINKMSVIE